MDDVTRAMSKGGGVLVNVQEWGRFFKLMTSRGQCPRGGGGAPGVPPIQVQTPPTWLAGYGPDLSTTSSDYIPSDNFTSESPTSPLSPF